MNTITEERKQPYLVDAIPDERTKAHLEFVFHHEGGSQWMVFYELVLPLGEVDCRGTFDHKPAKVRPISHRRVYLSKENNMRIPLGRTGCDSSNPDYPFYRDGVLSLPFRDGAHASWDREKLGLEVYAITPKGIYHVPRNPPKKEPNA